MEPSGKFIFINFNAQWKGEADNQKNGRRLIYAGEEEESD